jgi:disulfide bond formation protein DsbB
MRRVDSQLWLAAGTLVAVVATAWSLYLSLGLGLVPCELCWYQRILMYPLTVILGVAALENRARVCRTALPLSVLGAGIAAYHSWLQISGGSGTCSIGGGCSAVQYQFLGLSVPNLSLIAFVLVSLTLVAAVRRR